MVLITVRQLKDGQHSVTCFIDAKWQNDNELKISVLKESTAFTTTVNINSECIKKWSRNLQLTPEQYLSQLYSAMEGCNQQSSEAVRNSDHVFDVQDFCLTWKQYFKDKAVHGKRGNIPLDSVPHSEACWMILESAATEQQQQSLTMREIQSSNERLLADAAAATQLAEKSVKQLTSFKELTYLKFCHLLNSKKEEIRSLHEKLSQMKESDPDGRTTSDVTSFLPNKQRAAQSNQKHKKVPAPIHGSSDDDFDADTDVDEVNTDEEDELTKTSESSALKRKHSHNDNVSSNKRPEPWNFSQETELLNISSGNSECLLSNIRPREQVSYSDRKEEASTSRGSRDPELSSFVANVLRRNIAFRKANGYQMPVREVNDISKTNDVSNLSKGNSTNGQYVNNSCSNCSSSSSEHSVISISSDSVKSVPYNCANANISLSDINRGKPACERVNNSEAEQVASLETTEDCLNCSIEADIADDTILRLSSSDEDSVVVTDERSKSFKKLKINSEAEPHIDSKNTLSNSCLNKDDSSLESHINKTLVQSDAGSVCNEVSIDAQEESRMKKFPHSKSNVDNLNTIKSGCDSRFSTSSSNASEKSSESLPILSTYFRKHKTFKKGSIIEEFLL